MLPQDRPSTQSYRPPLLLLMTYRFRVSSGSPPDLTFAIDSSIAACAVQTLMNDHALTLLHQAPRLC